MSLSPISESVSSSTPPPLPPSNIHEAVIVAVSKPKRRWGGRIVIRLVFELADGTRAAKFLNVDYRHKMSALRRVCALLIGSPNANFRALVNRRCLVEIKHLPGKKYQTLMLPVAIARPDGSLWVPLGYGGDWEPPRELRERKRKKRTLIQKALDTISTAR